LNLHFSDISQWADSLENFKPEYTAVQCFSMLMFYKIVGRRTTIILENVCVIEDIKYCIYSPREERYYFKTFEAVPLELIVFRDPIGNYNIWDEYTNNLWRKIDDKNVWVLYTEQQIADITAMLVRLYKFLFTGEGKIPYKLFIEIMYESLMYEKYKADGRELTGYRTVCAQYERKITELWNKARKN